MVFLRVQKFMLMLIGYNTERDENIFWKIVAYTNLSLLLLIHWPEFNYVYVNISDIKKATDGLCPLLFGVSSTMKLLQLRFYRLRFYKVIWRLEAMWKEVNSEEEPILITANSADNRLSLPYIISTAMVGVLYLTFPIVVSSYEYLQYGNTTWEMPMRSILPYDISVSPNYELTYIWFVQSTFLCAFGAPGIDSIFYAGAFNLSAHFRIIQKRINAIKFDKLRRNGVSYRAPEELRKFVQYHNRILDLSNELTTTYKPILFAHFLISSGQICVIAFQLTLDDLDFQTIVTHVTFLVTIGFQCFIYCHGGTKLEVESKAVAVALYDSNWYQADVRTQRLLLLCLMRAQKPIVVSSVFFSANLSTFSSIISSAGSYIALLQTVSGS